MLARAAGAARRRLDDADELVRQARRARLVAQTKLAAKRVYATVELSVAPDVKLGRDVRVSVEPNTVNRLVIGPGCNLEDRVLIMLKGGQITLGPRVELRRNVILNVSGQLTFHGDNPVSWNSVVHCSAHVDIAEMAGIAEQVTIADSSHYWTTPDEHFWHNVRTGTVRVGRNTWICPKATLGRGADIGDHCLVASGSVVTSAVPDGSFASGVPAVIRPLTLPWRVPAD